MDQPTFDRWTTRLAQAPSRRALVWALLTAPFMRLPPPARAAQAPPPILCGGFGQVCDPVGDPCCSGVGLRCQDGRCRCRTRYQRCDDGPACVDRRQDAANCGRCGNRCRGATPCCIDGECRPRCGDRCCPNCFVELKPNGQPEPGSEMCCGRDDGTRCGSPRRDQQCCYPDEICLGDTCCGVINRGLTDCDGICCATDACCDGVCCRGDTICATPAGARRPRCVSGRRTCASAGECYPDEACDGGTCCGGLRRCYANGGAIRICCPPGEWCAVRHDPALATCLPVGEAPDRTYRGHRVRP